MDAAKSTPPISGPDLAPHPAEAGIRSTWIGLGVNAVLVVAKLTAGVLGHTYALVADALDSGMDVIASLLILVGLKVAAAPPDADHPQGHGKAEPLATVVVAVFLFLAAFGIARQSVHEIEHPHRLPAIWTLGVVVGVIIVKEFLARYIERVGEASGSGVVKADAQHQRSDVVISGAAFVGIAVALIGSHFSPDPRWSTADDWAALFAAGFIVWNGIGVLRGALYELTDGRPDTTIEADVRRVAESVAGVDGTDKCFIRKMGFDFYVELDVRVDPQMTVQTAHEITHAVTDAVRAQLNEKRFARILVHIEPTAASAEIAARTAA